MKNSFDLLENLGDYSPIYVKSFKPGNKFKIKKKWNKKK